MAGQESELERAINQAIKEAAAKGKKLSREDSLRICGQFGVDLNQYDFCGMSDERHGENAIFYVGNEQPQVMPEDVPLAALKAVKPDDRMMCPNHYALMAINQDVKNKDPNTKWGKYIGWKALVINKWEELDAQKAQEQLRQLGYKGIELQTFSENIRIEGGQPQKRNRQAILFAPSSSYTQEQKQSIIAQLRGGVLPEAAQTYAASQAQQQRAPSAQVPTAPESERPRGGIEELLPKGRLEETNQKLTVEVIYEGEPYKFLMPVLLNEFLAIDGEEGYRLAGTGEVTFTGRMYVEDAAARREAEKKLIAKDKRLRLRMSTEQQKTLETALQQEQSPAARQSLIRMTLSYVNEPGSGQQTL